ncbi:MAG: tRNA (adenosine(37)-N6)-threonylcarbamoyltransferase complex ATPase subunit type 1 TsaE [Deltaproteobacteria bacterium]|nr:tRNA (adenosine(37)-N6)-threonylcarbamoyltransferase complex ATPase subunit type 1 TsaE [Deltaproteobacteria bacterium]
MLTLKDININQLDSLSHNLHKILEPSDILGLVGELGAGKTTFVKKLARCYGVNSEDVVSPTFVLLQTYEGGRRLHHWDLYRLESEQELLPLDYEETFFSDDICFIEWFDKLKNLKPQEFLEIHFKFTSETQRDISFFGEGKRGKALVQKLKQMYQ